MTDAISTDAIRITGADDHEIEAYLARPTDVGGSRGSIVLIHHLPGYDRWTKEVARRFATDGYNVLLPNLYWREAPGADPDDAAAIGRANGGVPDARLVGDVAGAMAWLRAQPNSNGKVGVLGHCSGGRQSVLVGCQLDVAAVVDCYGAFVTGTPTKEFPLRVTNLVDQLPNLKAPVLGLFGADDMFPSPEHVAEFDDILTRQATSHEFHSYAGAGHAFFCTDRPSYRPEAALDGYSKIADFWHRYLD